MIKKFEDLTIKEAVNICKSRKGDCSGINIKNQCPLYGGGKLCVCDLFSEYPIYFSEESLKKEVKIYE